MSGDFQVFVSIGILVFLCYVGGGVNTYLSHANNCPKVMEVKK
jgi:hypothetical protein